MKRVGILILLLCGVAVGQQTTANITPASTGQKLGSVNQRWDAFIHNLDVSGTVTLPSVNGVVTVQGVQGPQGLKGDTGTATSAGDPIAVLDVANRRYTLNSADWQSLIAMLRRPLSSTTVISVAKSWNFNSILPTGGGTASVGYGNIWLPTNAVFGRDGCSASQFQQRGVTYSDNLYYQCQRQTQLGLFSHRFILNTDWVDYTVLDASAKTRVLVDGKATSNYYQVSGTTAGTAQYRIQPDSKPPHRIEVQYLRASSAGYVTPNGPTSSDIIAPDWNNGRLKVVIIGNSYPFGQQSAGTDIFSGGATALGNMPFAQRLCEQAGWDCYISGDPGTDFVAPGGTVNYGGRITNDVCGPAPALVIWLHPGWNDKLNVASVRAAALADFNATQACSSHPLQIVIGPISADGPTDTAIANVDAQIKLAVTDAQGAADNIQYGWSPIDEQWITGTHVGCGSLNTTGNDCFMIGSDGVHPTGGGSEEIAMKDYARFAQLYPQLLYSFDFSTPIAGANTIVESYHKTQQLTGTVSATSGTTSVVGVGTDFGNELQNGWPVVLNPAGGGCNLTPLTITVVDATHLTTSTNVCATVPAGSTIQLAMSPLPEVRRMTANGFSTIPNAVTTTNSGTTGDCPVKQVGGTVAFQPCAATRIYKAIPIWSASLGGNSTGTMAYIPPENQVLSDIAILVSTAANCTVSPTWALWDNTLGSAVVTITFTNGQATTNLAQTGQTYALTAGHLYLEKITAGTCTTTPVIGNGTALVYKQGT